MIDLTYREQHDKYRFRGYVASYGEISIGPTVHSPLCKLAREIIRQRPDLANEPWRAIYGGRATAKGNKLGNLAALRISESTTSTKLVKFTDPSEIRAQDHE